MNDNNQFLKINGRSIEFGPGETILEVAERNDLKIPTLCFDPRLKPAGHCRLCMVEIKGLARPVPACDTEAKPGMEVETHTPGLEQNRKVLLKTLINQIPNFQTDNISSSSSNQLQELLNRYHVKTTKYQKSAHSLVEEEINPFITKKDDLCILCYRCVRICAEQQGNHVWTSVARGEGAKISTAFAKQLKGADCEFCGQCVQTCPTGALADKKLTSQADPNAELSTTKSVCGYCGVGCGVEIVTQSGRIIGVRPDFKAPSNQGALCVKGQFGFDYVNHPDRLKTPLIRDVKGNFTKASWDDALDAAAKGIEKAAVDHGLESVYAIASSRAPNEAAYLTQKFIRAGFGTHQVDNCARN